jgi:hypothetical protein
MPLQRPSDGVNYWNLAVVSVAQLVEHRSVAPRVAGSNPVAHPNSPNVHEGLVKAGYFGVRQLCAKIASIYALSDFLFFTKSHIKNSEVAQSAAVMRIVSIVRTTGWAEAPGQ